MKKKIHSFFSYTVLIFYLSSHFTFAQDALLNGLPLIKNYLPSEYNATPQNWGIVQDKRGVMYFANTGGVLEYDGIDWRLIEIENDVARSIAIDSEGVIFVGGVDQFGYLEANSSGKLKYQSLVSLLPPEDRSFGDIWSIWSSGEGIFFQSASHLFLIKDPVKSLIQNNSANLKLWKSKSVFSPAFLVGDKFFVNESGNGLLTLNKDSLVLFSGGNIFANRTIYTMLPYPPDNLKNNNTAKILIGTETGFYILDGTSLHKFKTEADDYLFNSQLYFRGAILANNTYALGTQNGGLVIIDKRGKLKYIINKETGLNDNTVWFVYPGISGGLWLGLNNGIAQIIYPSPVTLIDSHFGLDGVIFSVSENPGGIYVTTTNGIYYSDKPGKVDLSSTFRKVEGIISETWELIDMGKYLLAGTTNGVYKLTGNNATPLESSWRFAYSFCRSKVNKNLIYVGLHDGIATLKFHNGDWIDGGRIPGISEIIFHIVEEENGTVWLSTYNKGLIKLIPHKNNSNSSYSISRYGKEEAVPEKQVISINLNGKIIFGTENGLISYDKEHNSFMKENMFGERFANNFHVIDLKKDIDGNFWVMGGKNNEFKIEKITIDENYKPIFKTFPMLNGMLDNQFRVAQNRIYPDNRSANIIWITASEKLYRFDINKPIESFMAETYYALIRSVKASRDSVVYFGSRNSEEVQGEDTEWESSPGLSSIEFSFSSTSYINESANRYQYYLEGFDSGWSEWTRETRKEYTNLSSGSYNFRVRASDVVGKLSEEASFGFYIPTPWFKSVWANFLYVSLTLFLIWWLVNLRLRFLEKKTVELELIVHERTREVRQQKDTLEEQAKKLLELDRLKTNFFTNISHEFRTPLTLIMGLIENIHDSISEEKLKTKLKMALSNSKRLLALINQLLELSRLEAGEIKLKITRVDLNRYLKKVLSAFESFAERKNIKLEFINDTGAVYVYFDREMMEEIFNNLISNAIKFTSDGGKISLLVKSFEDEDIIEIIVNDTGIGISVEALPHIFDRFYQADSSQTREYEGSGIGLAIVKELVELHQGTIKVESLQGKGTQFIIHLKKGLEHLQDKLFVELIEEKESKQPLTAGADWQISYTENFAEDEKDGNNIKEKEVVLVVEDNTEMLAYIHENLVENFNVLCAKNGEEGVNKAYESIPDLVITDVMMPVMNGYDLTARLKNDQRTSHIPIIMLTARADEESKLKGLDLGVDDYLVKPFSRKELYARVGNLIKLRTLLKERYKEVTAISLDEIEAKPIDHDFLEKVFTNIKTHVEDSQYGITVLANEVGMSVSQLNRKLNALIHQSAGKLIRTTKLDYAAKLLKNKAGNISEIAYRTGFSDAPSFTHSFKEKFGCTPSEYLKSVNKSP